MICTALLLLFKTDFHGSKGWRRVIPAMFFPALGEEEFTLLQ